MRVTWFGHSAFRLEFGASVVLIDPFLTGNPSFAGDPVAAAAGATHVVLTHAHADHVGDADAICRRGATLVANFEVAHHLSHHGLYPAIDGNTGGAIDCGAFRVVLTPALHSSSVSEEGGRTREMGLPNGVVIVPKAAGEPVVYHMGDTDIFPGMTLIEELWHPEIVMVPIGDHYTMGARAAALAVTRFLPGARLVLPCHWGTFPVLDAAPDAFVAAMGDQAGRVRIPEIGAAFEV
jgi:L-ascorbate metabolism protein UlaG (beta-lactamase superfamily)